MPHLILIDRAGQSEWGSKPVVRLISLPTSQFQAFSIQYTVISNKTKTTIYCEKRSCG